MLTALLRNNPQIVIDERRSHALMQGQIENVLGGIQVTRPQRSNAFGKLLLASYRRVLARTQARVYKKERERRKDPHPIHREGHFTSSLDGSKIQLTELPASH